MEKLSRTQTKVYEALTESIRKNGYAPSVRELCDTLHIKSPSTIHFHLKNLAELGYIEKGDFKSRAIVLKSQPAPAAPVQRALAEEEHPRADQVPVVGSVAAGSPILAQECIEDYLTFDTGGREGEYFALRVRGESMLGAGILPDDLVIVHRQSDARSGEIVVALLGEEATVKTLSRRGGEVWLLPANPDYSPIDGTDATILGRVTAVVRRY